MANLIKIKKGLDIPLQGEASGEVESHNPAICGIVPDDFPGFHWKSAVKEGDAVAVGSPLLYAKQSPEMCIASPLTGMVKEVRRGERRHIEAIIVERGDRSDAAMHKLDNADKDSRQAKVGLLCRSGLWVYMRTRPYDIVPDPKVEPRDIFVTAFDTAPLAPALIAGDMTADMERGLAFLSSLTSGRVYLCVPDDTTITSRAALVYEFKGPHPAGNAGVQIAAIKPVNKGEVVWTLDARTAVRIGRLLDTGLYDASAEVALTGPLMNRPCMVKTLVGACLDELLQGHLPADSTHTRIISGNVLTGVKESAEGFLRFPYRQVTLIEEGDDADEFMGWASIKPSKYSVKHSFLSGFRLGGKHQFDARLRGGRRAPILSGELDKVLPMDIYPEFLLRAIQSRDIDQMEKLGIYEVAPEDFALPEFVDTSKEPLQAIVRDGLDYLRKELS